MNLSGGKIALAVVLLCTTLPAAAEPEAPVMALTLDDGSTLAVVISLRHVRQRARPVAGLRGRLAGPTERKSLSVQGSGTNPLPPDP